MSRPTVLTFGGVILPHVNTIRPGRGSLADFGRTAGGLARVDTVRTWRSWEIAATPPASAVVALERHLEKIMWGFDEYWTLGMDAPTRARIDPESWDVEIVLGRSDWRVLSFNVVEQ